MWAMVMSSRSIPAGAGETHIGQPRWRSDAVDPRGCGGDRCEAVFTKRRPGRSPRVRGRQAAALMQQAGGGSIPAGAGETAVVGPRGVRDEVDPRGCGGDS